MRHIAVIIQVIRVDIEYHGDGGLHVQKAARKLARLGNKHLFTADARAAAQRVQPAADVHGGIHAAVQQQLRQHGGGRGFAVSAADAYGVLMAFHYLPQQHGAFHLGNIMGEGVGALGVVGRDGRGIDDQRRALHIARVMADENLHALGLQPLHRVAVGVVRAGDVVALIQQHLRQPRHAAAADADHMHALIAEITNVRRSHDNPLQFIYRHCRDGRSPCGKRPSVY